MDIYIYICVRGKINFLVGPHEPLLATVMRRKRAWFGHVTHHDSLFKIILQRTFARKEVGVGRRRRRGRQRKCRMNNLRELFTQSKLGDTDSTGDAEE